jgi:D-mannonate dehydratase
MGNYINQQYGVITGFTYEIMDESPWEIDQFNQLPYYIKVTGLNFKVIHDFRPESQFTEPNRSLKFIDQ